MKYWLSFPDVKKLLRDTDKEFNEMNRESLYSMAEDGKADVRSIEQQYKLMEQTLKVFRRIIDRKLTNLKEFKDSQRKS